MDKFKQFWEEHGSTVIRFWTNQIVMSILGISVGLALIALDVLPVTIIGCVFCIGILCFLQYDMLFMLGENHYCKPKEFTRPSSFLGLWIGLLGAAPTVLLCLIGLLLQLLGAGDGATVVKLIYYILHGSYLLLHSVLTGTVLDTSLLSQCIGWIFCILYTVPAVLACMIGYRLGSKDKPFRSFFGIKTKIKVRPERPYRNK